MSALFNFQFGDFFEATPSWFDWLTYWTNIILIAIGFIITFVIYYVQRCANAIDAYDLFQQSLLILDEAMDKTVEDLGVFKEGLDNPNDNFTNPILPVNLNDMFLQRIDLTSLIRYYKTRPVEELNLYKDFLKKSSYIGVYHDFFINELNYFRDVFLDREQKFQQHKVIASNLYLKVKGASYTPYNADFANKYLAEIEKMRRDDSIVNKGVIINRQKLNDEFIVPLIEIAFTYYTDDAVAAEVYNLANEINASRTDIVALKKNMVGFVTKSKTDFENIQPIIKGLLKVSK